MMEGNTWFFAPRVVIVDGFGRGTKGRDKMRQMYTYVKNVSLKIK